MKANLVLYGLLAGSVALNVVLLLERRGHDDDAPRGPGPASAGAGPATPVTTGTGPPSSVAPAPSGPASAVPSADPPAPASGVAADGTWQVTRATVTQSIAQAFEQVAGADAAPLSAVYSRLIMWDLDLRRDLAKDDAIEVAWRKTAAGDYEVAAAKLASGKKGTTLRAYRFTAPGDTYPSWWGPDGTEVPFRLKSGPLEQYEQITSLLKDRPTHKGMDFKTPVGTPVHTPRDGVVTRINWNWTNNGNSVEVKYDDGLLAKFLHLSKNEVTAGQRVKAGQVVALTGNTGHTTAPHLHYQLDRGETVVDPVEYHGTERRQLPAAAKADFDAEVSRLDALFR